MLHKKFIVDTIALNLFVLLTAFIVEIVISHIPFSIFWRGRLLMVLPNTLTVKPYSSTRNWIGARLESITNKHVRVFLRDTLVFILYRVPLIIIVLSVLGTPIHKVISASISATIISGISGRPYGIFLDAVRKLFHV